MKKKCQCPEQGIVSKEREHLYSKEEKSGMNHKPNQCMGTNNIRLFKRYGKLLWLCSCCDQFEDELVEN